MKTHNFSAGPCILPGQVFEEASKALIDFDNLGLSVIEISHRSKNFVAVMDEAMDLVKKALNVPAGYSVAYLQGGATLGFTIVALNMMRETMKAGYINMPSIRTTMFTSDIAKQSFNFLQTNVVFGYRFFAKKRTKNNVIKN